MPNAALAALIHTDITERPDHHNQEAWITGADVLHPDEDLNAPNHCGTTLCVAGYAAHRTGHTLLPAGITYRPGMNQCGFVDQVARRELDLSEHDANWLFHRDRTRHEVLTALGQLADNAPRIDNVAITPHAV
ncbi:hypothetical protein [Streptomyces lydicus]|uniref:hypothetical protein n=1 Tax=Streptomyces lydicus TaxID=47763 RepID=UPI001010B7FC|nr:hypothetical protein [Streptomyces lydicus]MCZ1012336.1 hypothetical protein [Streptomyces lydicus]